MIVAKNEIQNCMKGIIISVLKEYIKKTGVENIYSNEDKEKGEIRRSQNLKGTFEQFLIKKLKTLKEWRFRKENESSLSNVTPTSYEDLRNRNRQDYDRTQPNKMTYR